MLADILKTDSLRKASANYRIIIDVVLVGIVEVKFGEMRLFRICEEMIIEEDLFVVVNHTFKLIKLL